MAPEEVKSLTDPPPGPTPSPAPAAGSTVLRVGIAVVVLCAAAALFWPQGHSSFVAPGGFLVDAGGRPAPLAQRLAPATLVHFWATWCPPCLEEAPALNRLQAQLTQPGTFELLRVAVADSPEKVKVFLGEGAGAVLYDPSWDVAHRYGTRQLPETYLVVHGRVVEKWIGATDWSSSTVRAQLKAKLAENGIALATQATR